MLDMHRILGLAAHTIRRATLTALLGTGLLVSGCGQKGPLFLPATATSTAQPASAETDATNALRPLLTNTGH